MPTATIPDAYFPDLDLRRAHPASIRTLAPAGPSKNDLREKPRVEITASRPLLKRTEQYVKAFRAGWRLGIVALERYRSRWKRHALDTFAVLLLTGIWRYLSELKSVMKIEMGKARRVFVTGLERSRLETDRLQLRNCESEEGSSTREVGAQEG
ncbi:hypothetical protein ARMGADRAFT_1041060 [Armillaria gallica]|uniref:Uncharacterized protein n=1 Tax=Armillaria gallica TaxID=47427 RepID=A0A2H3C7M8_ARMGA|nr:hypothetical protein ARMGADRAFT_1041060 [Armillaria gallica]